MFSAGGELVLSRWRTCSNFAAMRLFPSQRSHGRVALLRDRGDPSRSLISVYSVYSVVNIPSSLGTRSARRVCAASCDRFAARALPSGNLTPSAQGHLPMGRKPPQGAVMFPVPRRWPSAFANSSSFCFILFPFFSFEKFAFVKMNLFSATFELVLSERRTCSQQAENLFKFRRDAPGRDEGRGMGESR